MIYKSAVLLQLCIFIAFLPSEQLYSFQDSSSKDPKVWSVKFEGNDSFRSIQLKNIIATKSPGFAGKFFGRHSDFKLNENEVRRDRIRIQRFYERRGYDQVDVEFEILKRKKEWKKDVIFRIREGTPIYISQTNIIIDANEHVAERIRNERDFQRLSEQHKYVPGRTFEPIRKPDVEGDFKQTLQDLGYAWAEVSIETEVDSVSKQAKVTILANPGPLTHFEIFQIEGDLTVPERVILRETGMKKGGIYSRDKMQEAQRQIFNHHLFRFATINLSDQAQDSTLDLTIRVRENSPRTLQTLIGVGREEIVRGQVSWQHRNINGIGHRLGTTIRASFIEQRLSTDYLIPFVFNNKSTNVTSLFGIHRLEPSFELFQAGLNNSVIYQWNRNLTATGSYEFTINEEMSRRTDFVLPDTVLNFTISSLSFTGYYSEGLSRQPRGWVVQPFLELSGTFGEASFRFQKLSLDVRRYTPISNSLTVAARINSGVIFFTQNDSLPGNIRFFTGGTNSVRGWSRQSLGPKRASFNEDGTFDKFIPVGGRSLLNFNLELRQQLNGFIPGFGVTAFLDGGQVWSSVDRVNERPIQFGTGGGLRYQSPIGPVRIDVGYKINPDNQDLNIFDGKDFGGSLSRIAFHFSIRQAF